MGTLTGLLWTTRKDLNHCLSTLPAPPRTGQLPEALGGSGLWSCLPPPRPDPQHAGQDGSQLVCAASFSLFQTHKEPLGL